MNYSTIDFDCEIPNQLRTMIRNCIKKKEETIDEESMTREELLEKELVKFKNELTLKNKLEQETLIKQRAEEVLERERNKEIKKYKENRGFLKQTSIPLETIKEVIDFNDFDGRKIRQETDAEKRKRERVETDAERREREGTKTALAKIERAVERGTEKNIERAMKPRGIKRKKEIIDFDDFETFLEEEREQYVTDLEKEIIDFTNETFLEEERKKDLKKTLKKKEKDEGNSAKKRKK